MYLYPPVVLRKPLVDLSAEVRLVAIYYQNYHLVLIEELNVLAQLLL